MPAQTPTASIAAHVDADWLVVVQATRGWLPLAGSLKTGPTITLWYSKQASMAITRPVKVPGLQLTFNRRVRKNLPY